MSLFDAAEAQYFDDMLDSSHWLNEEYTQNFAQYFQNQRTLYDRLKSKVRPITDEELETILVQIPLQLFSVSEVLNQYRLNLEVVKHKLKQRELKLIKESEEKTDTRRREDAAGQLIDDKIFISAISTLITLVENEITMSKELIMSAKKIWDSRRKTESVNPVSPIDIDSLPDYK